MPLVLEQYTPELAALAAKMLRAYLECSNGVQETIREMIDILKSPDVDDDERQMALMTIYEALFPVYHDGRLGLGLEEADDLAIENQPDGHAAREELDRQERCFADALRDVMEQKRITQEELARRTNVGQPAIAMMLARECRPQARTVAKLAQALGVPAQELWPERR